MTIGESQHFGWKYGRSIRNPYYDPQQVTCFYYPDEDVPRVNLTMPHPVVFTEGPGFREYRVKATTLVGGQEIDVAWKTWESRHDRLFLKNRDARQLITAIVEQQAQVWQLILPDNPEIRLTYSVVNFSQALAYSDMQDCFLR